MINEIKKLILKKNIDGYLVSKNDEYFTEYSKISNLKLVSNFSGSAGFAIIMKNKNYLFVDGRYTLQANKESGKKFNIYEIPYIWPKNIFSKEVQKPVIGFDPNLFTYNNLKKYFNDSCDFLPLNDKFFDNKNINNKNKFYSLNKSIVGESSNSKITRVVNFLNKKK